MLIVYTSAYLREKEAREWMWQQMSETQTSLGSGWMGIRHSCTTTLQLFCNSENMSVTEKNKSSKNIKLMHSTMYERSFWVTGQSQDIIKQTRIAEDFGEPIHKLMERRVQIRGEPKERGVSRERRRKEKRMCQYLQIPLSLLFCKQFEIQRRQGLPGWGEWAERKAEWCSTTISQRWEGYFPNLCPHWSSSCFEALSISI